MSPPEDLCPNANHPPLKRELLTKQEMPQQLMVSRQLLPGLVCLLKRHHVLIRLLALDPLGQSFKDFALYPAHFLGHTKQAIEEPEPGLDR